MDIDVYTLQKLVKNNKTIHTIGGDNYIICLVLTGSGGIEYKTEIGFYFTLHNSGSVWHPLVIYDMVVQTSKINKQYVVFAEPLRVDTEPKDLADLLLMLYSKYVITKIGVLNTELQYLKIALQKEN